MNRYDGATLLMLGRGGSGRTGLSHWRLGLWGRHSNHHGSAFNSDHRSTLMRDVAVPSMRDA